MPGDDSTVKQSAMDGWAKLAKRSRVYIFAQPMQSGAATVFAYLRSIREPGVPATSTSTAMAKSALAVSKAEQRLAKAQAKQEAMTAKVKASASKAKGKAKASSKPTGAAGSAELSWKAAPQGSMSGIPLCPPPKPGHLARPVIAGYVNPTPPKAKAASGVPPHIMERLASSTRMISPATGSLLGSTSWYYWEPRERSCFPGAADASLHDPTADAADVPVHGDNAESASRGNEF